MTTHSTPPTVFIPRRIQQQGLSLVELMIAIVLGIFLIWGVLQSFLTSRQAYNLQQGVGRIQENGRLAQEFLGFDIRNAGDYGCGSGDDFVTGEFDERNGACTNAGTKGVNMISDDTFATTAFEYAVYGYENVLADVKVGLTGITEITLGAVPVAGSDVLLLRVSEELGTLTSQVGVVPPTTYTDVSGEDFTIHKPLEADIADGQAVAISDCGRTRIFALEDANAGDTDLRLNGGDNYCFFAGFSKGASLRKLTTLYYFVAPSVSGTSTSLYRQAGEGAAPEELLEGVENMQLQFGVDDDGDSVIDSWEDATGVSDAAWNSWDYDVAGAHRDDELVRAVRYSLLLVTDAAVLGEAQPLVYNGTTVPADRRLRQVFTSSVGIRSLLNPDH